MQLKIKRYLLIDKALHNPKAKAVLINNQVLEIETGIKGQRYVRWGKEILATAKSKDKKTYIFRAGGACGKVVNGKIIKP